MIINRYNYEEYFLLYTDNELGEAERKAVEDFVEENPDLKNELLGFQDAVMHADEEIRYPGKKELLSSNASLSVINNDNYTEYFLLYGDNELNNEQKGLVEQYVYHHPELQGEFELLLKVKMEADRTIIFENKESLIRHAEKAPVILGWWKITASVAAALILILFGYLKYNGENDTDPAQRYSQATKSGTDSPQRKKPLITIENRIESKIDQNNTEERVPEKADDAGKEVEIRASATEIVKVDRKASPNQPEPEKADQSKVSENISHVQPREPEIAGLPDDTEKKLAISIDQVQSLHQENLQMTPPKMVIQVASVEAEESQLSIAGFPITSKSKVGSLISRTSRFINKTKKDISTRSERVIGNLEIAIR